MIFAGKFPTFMYNLLCVWQDWGLAPAVSPLHQHGGDRGQLRQVLQIFLPDNLLCDQHRVLGPLPQRALIICTVLYCTVINIVHWVLYLSVL